MEKFRRVFVYNNYLIRRGLCVEVRYRNRDILKINHDYIYNQLRVIMWNFLYVS